MALTRAFSGAICRGQVSGVGAGEGTGSPVAGALCCYPAEAQIQTGGGWLATVTMVLDGITNKRNRGSKDLFLFWFLSCTI